MNNLTARTTSGVAWTTIAYLAGQLVQVGAGVALARILLPADFGTAGLALVIAGIIATVNQFGMFASIVQRRELSDTHYDTALWTSVAAGAVFGGALYFAAGPVSIAFRNPGIVPVLRVYSLLLFAGGLSAVQSGLLTREFMFRQQSVALLVARVTGGALSVALALAGWGVMSIAWGYVVQMGLAAGLLSLVAFRVRRPHVNLSWTAFRDLFRFGFGVMGANLMTQLASGLDVMLVGRLLGPVSLGYYSFAAQTAAYLPRGLASVLPQVAFSAMSRVQDRAASLRSAYLRLARICTLVAVPLLAGLFVIAPDLVPAVFGAKWAQAILPMQILALAGMVVVLDWTWGETLKAQGRSLQLLVMTAGSIIALATAVWSGSHFGITGVAVALVCFRVVFWLGYQAVVSRSIAVPMRDYLGAVAGPALVAVVTGVAALGARTLVDRIPAADHWPALAAAVGAGLLAYAAMVPLAGRHAALDLLDLLAQLPRVGATAQRFARLLRKEPQPARAPRVCVMTSVHATDDARIFHKERASLERAGYDVTVLTGGPDGLRLPRGRLPRMTAGAVRMLLAAIRQQAQVYHFHDPELLPVGLALKLLGRRVVYDVHEDYPEQILGKHYIPKWLRRTAARAVNGIEKSIAARLDGIVAATDTIAGRFGGDRVIVVRNYPIAGPERPHNCAPGRFRLAHLSATLSEERGISNLVRMMGLLGDGYELLLAGKFVTDEYARRVRALDGFGHIQHMAAVPHEQVWDVYARCDAGIVCLLPVERYKVSLPVKLFEFMAAGLPVVASDFPLFRRIVEQNRCGLCADPNGPEALAEAVRFLAERPEQARRMGENGRAAVLRDYCWETEAATLAGLYALILGAGRSGHDRNRLGDLGSCPRPAGRRQPTAAATGRS